MSKHGIQSGKGPKNSPSATNGKGDMLKTPIGGSVDADKTGANRRGRR